MNLFYHENEMCGKITKSNFIKLCLFLSQHPKAGRYTSPIQKALTKLMRTGQNLVGPQLTETYLGDPHSILEF